MNTSAGVRLGAMMNSRDLTAQCLTNADTLLRLTAASLIAEYWPSDELFAAACLRLALDDPDAMVRGAALTCLLNGTHAFVRDAGGVFGQLMKFLRNLAPTPDELAHRSRRS